MSKPFNGLTFCCTGIESSQRAGVAEKIVALGGTHFTDLMSLVRYLVVGNRNTEKYKYSARYRHDVSFIPMSAIIDIYTRWKTGSDEDLSLDTHLLPIFSNFVVCLARVERPQAAEAQRLMGERFRTPPAGAQPPEMLKDAFLVNEIVEVMTRNGAKVSSTLTPACTVLIGTDTAGRRYTMAKEWKIPSVHPIWVFDSLLRGAALNLDDYEVTSEGSNLYNNGSFAWKKLFLWRIQKQTPTLPVPARRDKVALKKSSEIWSSIMSSTHLNPTKQVRDSTWDEIYDTDESTKTLPKDIEVVSSPKQHASTLFRDYKFLPVGFSIPQQKILKNVVESHLGGIADSVEDEAITHILLLVRNGPQATLILLMLASSMKRRINNKSVQVVTDWFIERLIFYNELRQDSWCKPLQGLVPSVSRFKVCVSGFTGVELLHIEKLITYLNLEFCEVLNLSRDLLIININLFKGAFTKNSPHLFQYKHEDILDCPIYSNGNESTSVSLTLAKNKINAAKKWNIPIVSIAYLWEMIDRLVGKASLQIPDISDKQWCIFAPQAIARPTSLLGYLQNVSNAVDAKTVEEPTGEDSVQLPSPRKAKDKTKYGRLVGGGNSLTEKLKRARDDTRETSLQPEELDNEELLTQVGYENQDSIRANANLMKKLEQSDRPAKRTRKRA